MQITPMLSCERSEHYYAQLVMAGLDPAIQIFLHTAAWLMNWMAASRAAMTS